jgi:hypothetical protein
MWTGVDQNDGGAASGTDEDAGGTPESTATVTISADHNVCVCCGESNAGAGCSGQCP